MEIHTHTLMTKSNGWPELLENRLNMRLIVLRLAIEHVANQETTHTNPYYIRVLNKELDKLYVIL